MSRYSAIEEIFSNVEGNPGYVDLPNISDLQDTVTSEVVDQLPRSRQLDADTVIFDLAYESEKRGFINGFRYAVKIMSACVDSEK